MKRPLLAVSFAFLFAPTTNALADKADVPAVTTDDWSDDDADHDESNADALESERHYLARKWSDQDYHRGEMLPALYLERRYYVDDYRQRGLPPPPAGQHWIRTNDGTYVLVAVATGLIVDVLLHP